MGHDTWPTVALDELTEPASPITYGVVKPGPEDPAGVKFVRGGDVADGRILVDQLRTITHNVSAAYRRTLLRGGELVVSLVGNPGQVAIVPQSLRDANIARQVGLVRLRDTVNTKFVKYFLGSSIGQQALGAQSLGSVQQVINLRDLKTVKIPIPPRHEQDAVAEILGTLDDKIELNRRTNETLEGMARALFKSWFVDFDPVRAKLDGRPPPGLDPATAALFPDRLQDSDIGPIPKGWNVDRFDAHFTAERGLSYSGEGLCDDRSGLPMHNLNSIYEGGGYKHAGIKYYAGDYREKHLVEPGDMIVTNTEQGFDHLLIGYAAIVPKCFGLTGLYSHHIYRVRSKSASPFSPHYLVELFNNRRWHYWISGFSNGTTINMLPKDALEMPMLVVPPVTLVTKFTNLAEAAHIRIEENIQQSRTLAAVRDALLPKLLSGEIRVGAAEKLVEDVA